jgi:hypothetical protein
MNPIGNCVKFLSLEAMEVMHLNDGTNLAIKFQLFKDTYTF